MVCINKSYPKFKNLSKIYGETLAEKLVIGYTKHINGSITDEYVYPTNLEIKSWLKKERDNGISHLTLALSMDPNIKEAGILSFLLGVVHKKDNELYITKGYVNSSSLMERAAAKKLVLEPNVKAVKELEEWFPDVVTVVQIDPTTYKVLLNKTLTDQQKTTIKERASDIYLYTKANLLLDIESQKERKAELIARALGDKLKYAFGMDYEVISKEDAIDILSNSETPYENQSAFFFNNKAYFIEGQFNYNNVLHEFSHPLIKSIGIMNPVLFNNLFEQLASDPLGMEIIKNVTRGYPNLEVNSDRFKEECLVRALELDASNRVEDLTNDPKGFKNFITNLLYALKKVFRKLSNTVTLKNLSSTTTLEDLSKMLVEDSFKISDLVFQESDYAEFKSEIEDMLDELKSTDAQNMIDAINRMYTESMFQIQVLNQTPGRLKEELKGKDGVGILRNLKEYLQKYETITTDPSKINTDVVIEAMREQQKDFRERGVAIITSLNELEVFTKRIQKILSDMKKSGQHLTPEGNTKIQYYKQFLVRQEEFLDSIQEILNLDESNQLTRKILAISSVVSNSLKQSRSLEFEFVNSFIVDKSKFMTEDITSKLKDKVTTALSKDGFSQAEIDKFIDEVINTTDPKSFSWSDSSLTRLPKANKYISNYIKEYYAKRIVKEDIQDLLSGKSGDLRFGSAMLTPYSNINDPVGAFVRFTKEELSNAEQKSLREGNEIAIDLLPHLKEVGYNPNKVSDLAKMILFKDTVPTKNNNGEYEEFEVHTVLNEFKDWRSAKGRLEYNLERAKEKGTNEEIVKATQDLFEFHEKYMHRKFKKEVYDAQKLWRQDNTLLDPSTGNMITVSKDLSTQAYLERQSIMDAMNTFNTTPFTEEDDLYEFTESDILKMQYEDLFNEFDKDGNYKTGDDLKKVLVRKKYRETSGKFYESSTNNDRVQKDLDHFVNATLVAKGITYDSANPEAFDKELDKFVKKNFRIAYTPQYFASKNSIMQRLQEINEKGSNTETAKELTSLFKQRSIFVKMVTDKNGQPNGLQFSPSQIKQIKKIEDRIVELQEQYDKKTGLTKEQLERLSYYEAKYISKNKEFSTAAEKEDYVNIINIKNDFGLDSLDFSEQRKLFAELNELRSVVPTEYYIQAFNNALEGVEVENMNWENAEDWINSPDVIFAKEQSSKFQEWFDKNHYVKKVFNYQTKELEDKYYRLKVWSVELPNNELDYQSTTLINPATKEELVIPGVPISKYSVRRVKDEYMTIPRGSDREQYVGKIINNKGELLPRSYEPGNPNSAADDTYINKDYIALRNSNNAQFRLIEAYTKNLLDVQKSKPKSSKLYLDFPRFRHRSNQELIQSGQLKENVKDKSNAIVDQVKSAFTKKVDDAETSGFNFNVEANLITTDLTGEPISTVPVRGLYKLSYNNVSMDVLRSLSDYMYSLNRQEALIEAEPVAKALSNVLNDPKNAIKEVNKVSKNILKSTGERVFKSTSDNKRAQAMDYFIDKVFYGQTQSSFQEDNPFVTKVSKLLMGSANMAFSALDIPSALKNKYGMLFQSMVEAAGGKYITPQTLAMGRIWSHKATIELATKGIYTKGPKTLELQLMEAFDPITGKTKQDFGKSTSRTFMKDFLDGAWMYDPRKLMEIQEGLNLFAGMMYNKFIDQVQPDGSVKKIKYMDAWELGPDQQLKLKDGINPEYGNKEIVHTLEAGDTLDAIAKRYNVEKSDIIDKNKIKDFDSLQVGDQIKISTNQMFTDFKFKIQGVGQKLNGLMTEEDSPQANKYLGYRLFSFYRKFAIPMFLNRFQMDMSKNNRGGDVYDWNLNQTGKGYYITALQSMSNLIRDYKNYSPLMTKEEKIAIKKVIAEGVYLALLAMAVTLIFGYDPGDEDRFEKMRNREDQYGAFGWASNHVLYQLIMIKKENESFIPLPGIGLNDWLDYTANSTIVTGPTIDVYGKIIEDLWNMSTGNEKAVYKREVGPYPWQQEDNYKLWNHLGSIFGIKGKTKSPIVAIKKAEMFENLR